MPGDAEVVADGVRFLEHELYLGVIIDGVHMRVVEERSEAAAKTRELRWRELLIRKTEDEVRVECFAQFGERRVTQWCRQIYTLDLRADGAGEWTDLNMTLVHFLGVSVKCQPNSVAFGRQRLVGLKPV